MTSLQLCLVWDLFSCVCEWSMSVCWVEASSVTPPYSADSLLMNLELTDFLLASAQPSPVSFPQCWGSGFAYGLEWLLCGC